MNNLKKIFLLLSGIVWGQYAFGQSFKKMETLQSFAMSCKDALEGFSKSNNANEFTYQSLQEGARSAMITRATDGKMDIDWYTSLVPPHYNVNKGATFLFLVDKDMGQKHTFNFYVNGIKKFFFGKKDLPVWSDTSQDGGILSFKAFAYDAYDDAQGYMTLYAPAAWLQSGKPLHLRITGAAENDNAWFMVFKTPQALDWLQAQAAYGNLFKLHYSLQDNTLNIDLKTSFIYNNTPLTFQLGNDAHLVKGSLQDSIVAYHTRFDLRNNSLAKQEALKVFKGKDILFITEYLFQSPDTSYVVLNKGIMIRRVKINSPSDEEEVIRTRYDPSLANNLLILCHKSSIPSPLYLMNSSHQDIAWMDSPAKCELMRDTLVITPLLKRMTADSNYHFDIEDVLMIREYLHRHPDRKALIKHFLDDGQLNVGGSFNMTYEDMYSGESLVREFYQGSLWMYKHFNYLPDTYWNVDVPGRTLQMPQILAKSGIKMMVLSRMGEGLFNWIAPDGSGVLTYSPGQYGDLYFAFHNKNNIYNGFNYLAKFELDINKKLSAKENNKVAIPLLWDMDMIAPGGSGIILNHWNRITYQMDSDDHLEKIKLPRITYSTSSKVYHALKGEHVALPGIKGGRPNVWIYIHGPSHERALHASRDADILLPAAEKFATFNSILKGNFDKYPVDALHKAWEAKIYPDHGWGGKHGNITDNSFLQKFLSAKSAAQNILNISLQQIASKIKFRQGLGKPVVVFNSLSWKRDAPVNAGVQFTPGEAFSIKIVNDKGDAVPVQLMNKKFYKDHSLKSAAIYFIARNIPSIGYATYYMQVQKDKVKENNNTVKDPEIKQVFESDYYRIQLGNGGLKSIYDKTLHKELLNTHKFLGGEIFTMHSFGNGAGEFADIQQPDMQGFDKTSLHPCHWKIVADGPVFTALQFRTPIKYAEAQLTVILYKHLKRIDLKADILNWQGVLYREFRMALPLNMKNSKVAYQVPFGILRVGQDELHRAAGERYKTDCRLVHPRGIESWIGAHNDTLSITLSSDVAAADYIDPTKNPVNYTILQPILLASRKSCNAEGNEYLQTGGHHFTFSLNSGKDDLSQQDRKGISDHVPLFVVVDPGKSNHAFLNENLSFLHANNRNIIVTAVKKAENNNAICVRFYNTSGKSQTARLHFFKAVTDPVKTNLIEQPLGSLKKNTSPKNTIEMPVNKYGIETFITNIEK